MIVATVAELDALPVGRIVYDRDHEMYLKRADGLWAYPARNPTLSTLSPNSVMRYEPLQTLETIASVVDEVHSIAELEALPEGSVVSGKYVAEKRVDSLREFWRVAGHASGWRTDMLAARDPFPLAVLRRGRP